MRTDVSRVPANAYELMSVMPSGSVIDVMLVPSKECVPIFLSVLGRLMSTMLEVSEGASIFPVLLKA